MVRHAQRRERPHLPWKREIAPFSCDAKNESRAIDQGVSWAKLSHPHLELDRMNGIRTCVREIDAASPEAKHVFILSYARKTFLSLNESAALCVNFDWGRTHLTLRPYDASVALGTIGASLWFIRQDSPAYPREAHIVSASRFLLSVSIPPERNISDIPPRARP